MHCRRVAQIAAIAAAIVLAETFAGLTCAQESHPAVVSGEVRNRLTGQPIARALVDAQIDAVLTDSEGRFELHLFSGLSTGVQVRRPGYTSGEEGSGGHRLYVQGDISGLVLYLTPTATITGHVSVPDDADTIGMNFIAYRRATRNGHTQWQQVGSGNTNTDGVFKMYDLPSPGDYVLCNRMFPDRTAGPRQGKPLRGIPSQCYPSDPGDSLENLLHISPGQKAEVEIPRTMQPFYPVKIRMANQPAGHGSGFEVYSQNGIPTGAGMQQKDEGVTEVDLPNGSYYAEHRNWGKEVSYGRVDFKVENGSPVDALTLVPLPLAPVVVQFHKDFTARAEEQGTRVVMVNNAGPPAQLELTPADGMYQGGGGRPIRHTEGAPGDVFEMDGVTPGRYWVQASWAAEGYVSAISSGGVDLLREPLTIGPGNTMAPIEVTLRNDTGQIDCTVNEKTIPAMATNGFISNASNVAGPTVYAIPAGARLLRGILSYNAGTGPNATTVPVSMPNLAPGTYHVVALENYRDIDWLDDQQLARLEDKGKTVTVPAGGTVNVQVDVIKSDDEEPGP